MYRSDRLHTWAFNGAQVAQTVTNTRIDQRKLKNDYLGRFAPYLERACLRSLTPCKSRAPRTMW